MFARTAVSRLRSTLLTRAVSSFAAFIKESKGKAVYRGLKPAARGRLLGASFRALSVKDRSALNARAKTMRAPKRRVKVPAKRRAVPVFAKFIKANAKKVGHLPARRRLPALAKLYRASKK